MYASLGYFITFTLLGMIYTTLNDTPKTYKRSRNRGHFHYSEQKGTLVRCERCGKLFHRNLR